MTALVVLAIVLVAVFIYAYKYHKDSMSNKLAQVGTALSGIFLAIKGFVEQFDYQSLTPYLGDWKTFAYMFGFGALIWWARNVKAD